MAPRPDLWFSPPASHSHLTLWCHQWLFGVPFAAQISCIRQTTPPATPPAHFLLLKPSPGHEYGHVRIKLMNQIRSVTPYITFFPLHPLTDAPSSPELFSSCAHCHASHLSSDCTCPLVCTATLRGSPPSLLPGQIWLIWLLDRCPSYAADSCPEAAASCGGCARVKGTARLYRLNGQSRVPIHGHRKLSVNQDTPVPAHMTLCQTLGSTFGPFLT